MKQRSGDVAQRGAVVHVGIVLYANPREEIERLVTSLRACTRPNGLKIKIEFLDNSPDTSLRKVIAQLGVGRYQSSGENLGFGRGHNRLMQRAFSHKETTAYVCVNPDAVLHPDCIAELVARSQRNEKAGLVEASQFPDEHPKHYDRETHHTPWCSGCVLLVTRRLYETVGAFDDAIFMYCEDVDLSWRARAAGLSTLVAPKALAFHHVGDRKPSTTVTTQLLTSAAYLAKKYGDLGFAAGCVRELAQLGAPKPRLPEVPAPTAEMRAVANFKNLFHFAEVRW